MIVRTPHPDGSGRDRFVPLRLDGNTNKWVPIIGEGGKVLAFDTHVEAIAACLERLLRTWRDVYHVGRMLRVMCEHARFDFQGDGPDAEMVRREAQQLARDMYTLDRPLRHLLGEATKRDKVDLEDLFDSDLDHEVADEPPESFASDLHDEVTRPLLLAPPDDSPQEPSEDDPSLGDPLDDAPQESPDDNTES